MKSKSSNQKKTASAGRPVKNLPPRQPTKGGTGQSFAGSGILKSVDGGRTW